MKLILLVDVKKVGKRNQIVDVKDGYGSFLINSGKAIANSPKAQDIACKQIAAEEKEYAKQVHEATELKNKIEALTLNFKLKTNKGQTFGSISNKQIIEELFTKHNIKIDKFMLINAPISYTLGVHRINIKLHKEVNAILMVKISGE